MGQLYCLRNRVNGIGIEKFNLAINLRCDVCLVSPLFVLVPCIVMWRLSVCGRFRSTTLMGFTYHRIKVIRFHPYTNSRGGSRTFCRGRGPVLGDVDRRHGHLLVKMNVKTKELGPIVEGICQKILHVDLPMNRKKHQLATSI